MNIKRYFPFIIAAVLITLLFFPQLTIMLAMGLMIGAGVYFLRQDRAETDETDDDVIERVRARLQREINTPPKQTNTRTVSSDEDELFKEITAGLRDDDFDPPIPLTWETFNPMKWGKKKKPEKDPETHVPSS